MRMRIQPDRNDRYINNLHKDKIRSIECLSSVNRTILYFNKVLKTRNILKEKTVEYNMQSSFKGCF